ncbi:hypothetical protein BT69DRAFT_1280004 [Atractiella rhizophila]|nr:hypothetical protein BT69DRAFT_1280004 [Atractiella rhizophila]
MFRLPLKRTFATFRAAHSAAKESAAPSISAPLPKWERPGWLKTEAPPKSQVQIQEPTRVGEPFIRAQTNWLAVSPQKLNEFSRFMASVHNLSKAIVQAEHSKKGIARPVADCLRDAQMAYIRRFPHSDIPLQERINNLVIRRTWVQKSQMGKGIRIHGRGRSGRLHHRSALFRAEICEVTPWSEERSLEEKIREKEEKKFRKMLRGGVGKNKQTAGVVRDDVRLWALPTNHWQW